MKEISRRILGFGFISAIISITFPAFAAPYPLIKCRFLGQKTTYKGKLYTCIKGKSNGKTVLMWDSGKVMPVPSASGSHAATPTSSPTVSRTPVVVNKIEIPIAKTSEVPGGSTKSFTAKNRYGESATYILARNSNGLTAMSAICTHQGCVVALSAAGLLCPCHNALFDSKNGEVLRGPAAYPLDRLEVREAGGVIYITD